MANPEHLEILKQGVKKWNEWRNENPEVIPALNDADLSDAMLGIANLRGADLRFANLYDVVLCQANLQGADLVGANLCRADLAGADLSNANLSGAYLSDAYLRDADLTGATLIDAILRGADLSNANLSGAALSDTTLRDADLRDADLSGATLYGANLSRADLTGAYLVGVNLCRADLVGADLSGADLSGATLIGANLSCTILSGANLTDCMIFGISAWKLKLDDATQKDLVISEWEEPVITVDNIEVAQFIYLLLNNEKIRDVINTITSKAVLILGRFAHPQRKAVLDGLREKLRKFDLLPIVFDFDRPTDRDYTETVQTLAGMSMFVIADITNPKSTPLELEAIVKQFKIPYIPIIDISVDPRPFAMLIDSQKSFHWVLKTLTYESKEDLLDEENLKAYIIDRAVDKINELRRAKNEEPEVISIPKKAAKPA